jgi:hypothetical protein
MKIQNHADMFKLIKELMVEVVSKKAINLYVKRRQQFEGWLQVEIVNMLITKGVNDVYFEVKADNKAIDIAIGENEWAIELKVVSRSVKDELCEKTGSKAKTDFILSILNDIEKLKKSNYRNKAVVFVVSPLKKAVTDDWMIHTSKKLMKNKEPYKQIIDCIEELKEENLVFDNQVEGRLYYGKVQ